MTGKQIRMRRIFKNDGKSVIAALDFGLFQGTVKGLENAREAVQKVVDGGADAIIMSPGFAKATWDIYAGKAALILRVTAGRSKFNTAKNGHILITSVEEAVALGADAIMNMVFIGADEEQEMFELMKELSEKCMRYGIVLFTELLPANFDDPFNPDWIDSCIRLGFEHGADAVKTYYASENYESMVRNCPVPVVMAGGPKTSDFYEMVENAIRSGAAGVAIGRNVYGSENPQETVSKLVSIVHGKQD